MGTNTGNTVTNVTRVEKAQDFMIGWYSYFVKGLFHGRAQLAYGYKQAELVAVSQPQRIFFPTILGHLS